MNAPRSWCPRNDTSRWPGRLPSNSFDEPEELQQPPDRGRGRSTRRRRRRSGRGRSSAGRAAPPRARAARTRRPSPHVTRCLVGRSTGCQKHETTKSASSAAAASHSSRARGRAAPSRSASPETSAASDDQRRSRRRSRRPSAGPTERARLVAGVQEDEGDRGRRHEREEVRGAQRVKRRQRAPTELLGLTAMGSRRHLAALGDGDRRLHRGRCSASSRPSSRPASSGSTTYARFAARGRGDGVLPAAARPDDRGGARQVRVPLHRGQAVGPPAPPVRGRARASSCSAGCSPASLIVALAPFAKQLWGAGGVLRPDADRRVDHRSPRRPRTSRRARSSCAAATTSAVPSWRVSMALRLIGLAVGCRFGLDGAVLGMAVAQVVATARDQRRRDRGASGGSRSGAVRAARRRLRRAPALPRSSSTFASSLDSARGTLGTSLVPTVVARSSRPAYFRNAQAPATGFAALSGPVRLVMLTEQTRDFEAGRLRPRRPRCCGATSSVTSAADARRRPGLLGADAVPDGARLRARPTACMRPTAARLILVAAALRLDLGLDEVVPGLDRPAGPARRRAERSRSPSSSRCCSCFAARWGATGAAGAMLVSTVVFCAVWSVVLLRLRPTGAPPRSVPS